MQFDKVQDSGNRSEYSTGAHRDATEGKGLPYLIPTMPLRRLAQHFENGAVKYGVNNWQKGIPLSRYYDSAQRHLWAILEKDLSEDHYAAVMWNIATMIQTIEWIQDGTLSRELDDLGITAAINQKLHTIGEMTIDLNVDTTAFDAAMERLKKSLTEIELISKRENDKISRIARIKRFFRRFI
jgi:hypothetical protein